MTALHTEEYRRFAQSMADARRAAGVSQKQLAKRLGVTQDFISKYEGGRRRLDVIEFLRIVDALGASASDILSSLSGFGKFSD